MEHYSLLIIILGDPETYPLIIQSWARQSAKILREGMSASDKSGPEL